MYISCLPKINRTTLVFRRIQVRFVEFILDHAVRYYYCGTHIIYIFQVYGNKIAARSCTKKLFVGMYMQQVYTALKITKICNIKIIRILKKKK